VQVGTISAEDTMDDGSPIKLAVTIDRSDGSAVFDFEGTNAYLVVLHGASFAHLCLL
jgi:5-oxoprolinase (ATP-hydrolysing)